MNGALAAIEKEWNSLNPNEPFEYSFLDQDFQKNYEAESRLASMISYFTIIALTTALAVLIALLTVSFQAIKAALVNPVNNLRTE